MNNIGGINIKAPEDTSALRVTEFAKPKVIVKGTGTYSNPWEFDDRYYVELYTSNKNLGHFGTNDNVKTKIEGYAEECDEGYCFTADIYTKRGYRNDPIDGCGLIRGEKITETSSYYITRYKLSNIKSDVNCVTKYKKVAYNVTLHDTYYRNTFTREVAIGDCFGPNEMFDNRIRYYSFETESPSWGTGEMSGQVLKSTHTFAGYCFNKYGSCGFAVYLGGFFGPIVIDSSGRLIPNTRLVDSNRCWIYEGNIDLYSFDRRWG